MPHYERSFLHCLRVFWILALLVVNDRFPVQFSRFSPEIPRFCKTAPNEFDLLWSFDISRLVSEVNWMDWDWNLSGVLWRCPRFVALCCIKMCWCFGSSFVLYLCFAALFPPECALLEGLLERFHLTESLFLCSNKDSVDVCKITMNVNTFISITLICSQLHYTLVQTMHGK